MSNIISIVIPTFNRPHALERAAKNAHENTTSEHSLVFVVEPSDDASMDEVIRIKERCIVSKYPGSHTGAANTAFEKMTEPFFMIANDDFNFHKGWDELALKKFEDPNVGVVGVNDGLNHMTAITLVRTDYVKKYSGCIDTPNVLYYPGYNHNYVDTEFYLTACHRGAWAQCPESVVEHMHWAFNKSPKDATYEKSNNTAPQDQSLFNSRQHLWQ